MFYTEPLGKTLGMFDCICATELHSEGPIATVSLLVALVIINLFLEIIIFRSRGL